MIVIIHQLVFIHSPYYPWTTINAILIIPYIPSTNRTNFQHVNNVVVDQSLQEWLCNWHVDIIGPSLSLLFSSPCWVSFDGMSHAIQAWHMSHFEWLNPPHKRWSLSLELWAWPMTKSCHDQDNYGMGWGKAFSKGVFSMWLIDEWTRADPCHMNVLFIG